MSQEIPIPVTILTGFIGAGKTTLLNNLLHDMPDQKVAVIINEFGDTSIDSHLVVSTKEEIMEINSGCICCNVRGDLINILSNMMKQETEMDHIIIETTGMANPAPVIQTFLMDEQTAASFELDSVITMVDAKHIWQHVKEEESGQQIAFADVLLINKMDLITEAEKSELEQQLINMNPHAERIYTTYANVDNGDVIGKKSFELEYILNRDPNLLTQTHHHHHNDQVTSYVFRDDRPLDLAKVNKWFAYLVQFKGEHLYRYKGVLYINQLENRVVFQGVHMLFAGTESFKWADDEKRQSEIVFIGKHLDYQELERGFQYCLA
ncbi:GTP-binding protein [Gracilibacillus caseinilyticus]|uniref:GTP-binding protein n=1 Tax=Gracilibacillus caseinilyticus TaxID=2932256 RepID=A0ABY4EX15_9BACI|nr:GTP-binding protein [Gracilibacillus caseinilyticus]UOQ48793.1 GTP-binding protein [Gracilibacillus caseinilyticus]